MELTERIDFDLKEGMKEHNAELVSVLRLLKGALKNAEINKKEPLSEQEAISVLEKQAKQRRDSIEQYRSGNREDLAQKEAAELNVIEQYLPEKLSDEDISKVIDQVIAETGANSISDLGRVIKEVMSKTKGSAEGSTVSRIAKEKLS